MPVYVKVDDCKDVIDILTLTQEKVQKARYLLEKIHELKGEEDAVLAKWKSDLDDVEARVKAVDQQFSEPEL
ncbi:MAG: hypothetical protein ACE5FT_06760 [Candidatus Nanoarchaeia archaeon]